MSKETKWHRHIVAIILRDTVEKVTLCVYSCAITVNMAWQCLIDSEMALNSNVSSSHETLDSWKRPFLSGAGSFSWLMHTAMFYGCRPNNLLFFRELRDAADHWVHWPQTKYNNCSLCALSENWSAFVWRFIINIAVYVMATTLKPL